MSKKPSGGQIGNKNAEKWTEELNSKVNGNNNLSTYFE